MNFFTGYKMTLYNSVMLITCDPLNSKAWAQNPEATRWREICHLPPVSLARNSAYVEPYPPQASSKNSLVIDVCSVRNWKGQTNAASLHKPSQSRRNLYHIP